MDVERTIEFLLAQDAKHEQRLGRLETLVEKLAENQDKMAENQSKLDDVLLTLAESHIKTQEQMRATDEKMRVMQEQMKEQGRAIDQRIDRLVSAMGEFISRRPN